MKTIFNNRYINSFNFSSVKERNLFLSNINAKVLVIEETWGDRNCCYVCYNSLSGEKEFAIAFDTDESENLRLMIWNEFLVLETTKSLLLIDPTVRINATFEISSPLIGLHALSDNKLLILEEAAFKLIDLNGKILKSVLFDLIETFELNHNKLHITTSNGDKLEYTL